MQSITYSNTIHIKLWQFIDDQHVDNIANDLRRRMTFDCLFEQVDDAITEYAEDCGIDLSEPDNTSSFGFQIYTKKEAV